MCHIRGGSEQNQHNYSSSSSLNPGTGRCGAGGAGVQGGDKGQAAAAHCGVRGMLVAGGASEGIVVNSASPEALDLPGRRRWSA